jgi:hypothetical protein
MRIVNGSKLRVNVRLSLRGEPTTAAPRILVIHPGVQVEALCPPANGWLYCVVRGWEREDKPGTLYSEAHVESSIQAQRGGGLRWHRVEQLGYLSMANAAWLTVEDGPE